MTRLLSIAIVALALAPAVVLAQVPPPAEEIVLPWDTMTVLRNWPTATPPIYKDGDPLNALAWRSTSNLKIKDFGSSDKRLVLESGLLGTAWIRPKAWDADMDLDNERISGEALRVSCICDLKTPRAEKNVAGTFRSVALLVYREGVQFTARLYVTTKYDTVSKSMVPKVYLGVVIRKADGTAMPEERKEIPPNGINLQVAGTLKLQLPTAANQTATASFVDSINTTHVLDNPPSVVVSGGPNRITHVGLQIRRAMIKTLDSPDVREFRVEP